MERKFLNLGCQIHYFEGWINQDVVSDDNNIKAEIYGDAAKLPLEDGSIDFIYAGHLVEHYYPDTINGAVKEWYRVLKPGGKLVVITPDCGKAFIQYAEGRLSIDHLMQPVYGRIYSYDSAPERHHIVYDRPSLYRTMSEGLSWASIQDLDFYLVPEELKPFFDRGDISRSDLQLGIILTK